MFKQIDQAPLAKISVPKAQLAEESIPQVHQYSMLMRFRGNKDLHAVAPFTAPQQAPSSSQINQPDDENYDQSNLQQEPPNAKTDDEYKWWHEADVMAAKRKIVQKKVQAKQAVEQDRYVKALRALVSEKGQHMNTADWKDDFFEAMEIQM